MKTQRRQDLKTNDLAQMLEEAREFLQRWGSYLVGGALLVIVLVALMVYRAKAAEQQLSDAWLRLSDLQQNSFLTQSGEKRRDDEIEMGFAGLQELADQTEDSNLLFEALASKGQIAAQLAMMGDGGVDSTYLDKAAQAYNALMDQLPDNPLAVALALNGLVNVEADRFVLDDDPTRKEKARGMLERLAGDSRFNFTPYQKAAADRLNQLDETFRPVKLAPAPAPVTLTPVEGPPAPRVTGPTPQAGDFTIRTQEGVEIKRVPGPPPADSGEPSDDESGFSPAAPEDLAAPESGEEDDQELGDVR